MQGNLQSSITEPTLGGVVVLRRRLMGNALGANVSNADGRVFTFSFRLEPSLVRHLGVSYYDLVIFLMYSANVKDTNGSFLASSTSLIYSVYQV